MEFLTFYQVLNKSYYPFILPVNNLKVLYT